MEVFSVFATLSLVDMISGPLDRVRRAMRSVEGGVATLGQRMGNLALAMAPVALAAGVMLGAFGMAASKAMAFESAMADVAKVVNFETQSEFQAMNKTVMDMAGRIPMAADGIAAIIAAAGQSGVAKQDLAEFAEQAAKMGVAFDLTGDQAGKMMSDWRAGMNLTLPQVYSLADAVNHLSNNMNATAPALGEVIQRVGAVAMVCGLSETKVAALGAAFLSAGASPEVAATALKSFTTTLVKGTAMSKDQAAAFASIGLSATQLAKDMQTDAQGTIFKVLEAIAAKPKELQMSLLTTMFGQEALGSIAPLLQNMGNLSQAFELVGDKANYAGSMQAEFDTRSKTVANTLQLLSNKLTNLAISVGNAFLPSIGWAAEKLSVFVDMLRAAAETRAGQWLLQLAGAMGTALVALTALSASMWFFSALPAMLGKALLPLKTALLGLGAPIYAAIAVLGLLYAAYRTNFGGMADYLHECWNKITLTVKGVLSVFQTLKDGSGEIRGELATQIKAAGLVGLVTTVSRVVYRIQAVFKGFSKALSNAFARIDVIFVPVRLAVAELMQALSGLFGLFTGNEVTSAASSWEAFGAALGEIAGGVLEGLATGFAWLVDGVRLFASVIGHLIDGVSALCGWLLDLGGATNEANAAADPFAWSNLGKVLGYVLGLFVAWKAALLAVRGVMVAVSAATKAWAAVQWVLNAAMSANPIGLVVIAIAGLIAAGAWLVQNWDEIAAWWNDLWGGIAAWTVEKWDAITGTITGAWDSIISGITGFGVSILSGLQGAWDTASGAASAAWEGIKGIVSGAWDAIVGGIAGFGASLLAGITEAWNAVLEFFGGLNLFESGAKLLSTFVDGIKSMASSVVESVEGVFTKVREYLPFSDAHVGPLSQLTLSGARMMTTLAEGVTSAQGGLVSKVSGALSAVGGAIRNWWNGLGTPAKDAVPDLPKTPAASELSAAVRQAAVPDMPPLRMEAEIPAVPPLRMEAPTLPSPAPLELRTGAVPELPGLEVAVPAMPEAPAMAAPELPSMPEMETPEVVIPQAPSFDVPDAEHSGGSRRTGGDTGGQTISIYGDIILPGVQNAEDFGEAMRQYLQGEISMMEGMA
ncbi:phage tail tape measure protein [Desulfovibrio piger]|uniref:phage tail tape measure protein n=1 Tax=Desulfovibrio piger TaxID=901 RepID=UPI0026F1BC37|nr:phage tail tape measure protein [Desulfovibrio piger]